MSCEKYSSRLTEAALGELRADREPELLAHVTECSACREAVARSRAVHEFVDRRVEALISGEPSLQFAAQLRHRIAQQPEPQRFPWIAWTPVLAGALALAAILLIMVAREPMHNGSIPGVASAVNPTSVPSETITASAAAPPSAERMASTPHSKHGAQAREAAAANPEIIVLPGQLAAAAQLSAAIRSGRVDGNQLVAARQNYEMPLDVKPIEIAPLEIPALDAAAEPPAGSLQF